MRSPSSGNVEQVLSIGVRDLKTNRERREIEHRFNAEEKVKGHQPNLDSPQDRIGLNKNKSTAIRIPQLRKNETTPPESPAIMRAAPLIRLDLVIAIPIASEQIRFTSKNKIVTPSPPRESTFHNKRIPRRLGTIAVSKSLDMERFLRGLLLVPIRL